ncbi:DUF5412 family protein [Paenibacillus lemnae]|uniref:DUF5412 domain-containing protein n=1 Tax=Paenibacillus lemnae TaxID=1330551 RepID=A0A848M8W5_PAELE|nr:DUF5412 family protein [Paenibacillus lemnae]NMO97095.1 DUF5412 domain-containing protein [Paenibacillus lemnae]
MKKKRWGWIAALIVITLAAIYIYLKSFTLLLLPKGNLIVTSNSPNNTFTFTAYLVNAGGATGSFAVRGEVRDNKSGKSRNLYWEYRIDEANVKWANETTITINDRQLDVHKDTYDFREHRNKNS